MSGGNRGSSDDVTKLVDEEEKGSSGKKSVKDFTFGRIIGEGAFGAVIIFIFLKINQFFFFKKKKKGCFRKRK